MSPQLAWWLPFILFLVLMTPAAGLGLPAHTLDNNVNPGTMGTDDFWPLAPDAFLPHQPNPLGSLGPVASARSSRHEIHLFLPWQPVPVCTVSCTGCF